jgi:hypothetical protein
MDLYCPRCGEPWDNDCIHEEVEERNDDSTYHTVLREFQQNGCVAFREAYGQVQCERTDSFRAHAAGGLFDRLGDVADGAAAMLEDSFV